MKAKIFFGESTTLFDLTRNTTERTKDAAERAVTWINDMGSKISVRHITQGTNRWSVSITVWYEPR